MAEVHRVRVNGQETTLEDPEPLASAVLYKQLTDQLWEHNRPSNPDWASTMARIVTPLPEAWAATAEMLADIDDRLDLTKRAGGLALRGPWNDEVVFPAEQLQEPKAAGIEVFRWDPRFDGRVIDEKFTYADFIDGHRDYSRELSLRFHFDVQHNDRSGSLNLGFPIQRSQARQDQTVSMSSHVWYSGFAETGYEGNSQVFVDLSEAQEIAMLQLIAKLGDITLD
ncbi:MAG TPA: hypothetical protein VG992_04920 [Candidatus Saccharimonadales bacterium]|nr:hypothetical protein [Candidatus Saccharimonadales bacterium]